MTQPRQGGDAESQWQQPPFDRADDRSSPAGPGSELALPAQSMGGVIVPAEDKRPPSVLESTLNVVNGVLWPVAITLAIFGIGNWLLNIFLAIVGSSLLGGIATEMSRRRKYLPPAEGDLR